MYKETLLKCERKTLTRIHANQALRGTFAPCNRIRCEPTLAYLFIYSFIQLTLLTTYHYSHPPSPSHHLTLASSDSFCRGLSPLHIGAPLKPVTRPSSRLITEQIGGRAVETRVTPNENRSINLNSRQRTADSTPRLTPCYDHVLTSNGGHCEQKGVVCQCFKMYVLILRYVVYPLHVVAIAYC